MKKKEMEKGNEDAEDGSSSDFNRRYLLLEKGLYYII